MIRLIIIAFLLVLPLATYTVEAEINLVPNSDFSPGLKDWTVSTADGAYAIGTDPKTLYGGRNSIQLRLDKTGVKKAGFIESKAFSVKAGQVYLLECAVKGRDIPSEPAPLLTISFLSSGQVKGSHNIATRLSSGPGPGSSLPAGTFDWQTYRFYARAFDGAEQAAIRISAPTGGVLWVADIRMTEVPVLRDVKYVIRDAVPIDGDAYGLAPEGYLTDGFFSYNQGCDNKKLSRGYKGLEEGITVTLSLPRTAMVERLVLSLVRVNCGHTLRKIEVFSGQYGQLIKVAEGPGYLTEEFDQRVWNIEVPVRRKTDTIELKLFGRGYLVPYEIMVVEEDNKKTEEENKRKEEEMKKYLLAGWTFLAAVAAPAAVQEPVAIENEYVRMEFAPAEGGVCKRMLYKPAKKELVLGEGAGYGLFRDRFWAPTWKDFSDVVYQHEVTRKPDSESIHLWGRGAGGIYGFTEVHKTITLTKGSPLVRAEYEIKNGMESFADADYGFWVHNFLGVVGGKNQYFIPTQQGIMEVLNDPNVEPKNKEVWMKNPARGWMAGIGDGGHGLAWSMDFRYLNLFYQYIGLAVPTCEWQYNRITVPSGQSLKTEINIMPFSGLKRVDGFFQGVTGSIGLPDSVKPGDKVTPTLELVGAGDRKLTLKFRSRLLPATGWTECGTKEVLLKNAILQNVAWPRELSMAEGTTVIGCEVLENGQRVGEMERPLIVGTASGKYALAPDCAQIGSKEAVSVADESGKLPEQVSSLEVVSPHVPWGKPYSRGAVKALILTDCGYQREIVELMQRFDLEAETEKIFYDTSSGYFNEIGERSLRIPQQAQSRLKKKLQTPLDVIMIAGLHWSKTFDDETRKAILAKVKDGTGLVIVAPVGAGDDLKEMLPFAGGEKKNGYGFMELRQKHYLTSGIPYELLPQIGSISYEGDIPAEKTLLIQKTGNAKKEVPVLSISNFGKGRIVCFMWDVYSHNLKGEGYAFSRITPLMLNELDGKTGKPGAMLDRSGRKISWQCWEYVYSALGRSLLWAANREPDLAAEVVARDDKGSVGVSVECPEVKRSAVLELTYRNKFSESEKTDRKNVELVKGGNMFGFTPPAGLMPGITLTDLRVLTPEGKVITWASGYYETKPLATIAAIELEKTIVPAGAEPVIRGQVKLSGEAGVNHLLEITVTDFYERLVSRQTVKPTDGGTAFEARLSDVLSMPMTVEVQLKKVGSDTSAGRSAGMLTAASETLDKRKEAVVFLRERTWNPKDCFQYEWNSIPFRGGQIPYLYDLSRRLIRPLGITSIMNPVHYTPFDVNVNAFPSPLNICNITDQKYREKSNAYAKTKDRKELIREPSLWDPAYREKVKTAMHNAAKVAMSVGGGLSYCLGDEMSLTSYDAYYDYDFSPASVAAYREWLKKHYAAIQVLNSEWEATYKDWSEIEPMTKEEASKRENGNYAPWADFRTFMDDSLSGFFDYLQKCLEEVDPQARISISGTNNAAAGNGTDWWKLSNSLKILHSYRVRNSEYLHQAFSRSSGMLVAPYLNNACGRISGPNQEASMWWGVFYECFGLTSLGMHNNFLPDLTLSETGAGAKNFRDEVRGGIWPLLRSVRRDPAPIAILYSQPSVQANFIMKREQRYEQARDAWVNLLHDLGLQFDFVAYAQVEEQGFLTKRGYKALILPEALALSDKETAEIKAFVSAGGSVIADNSVGWMDEHCRTLKTGKLDDLFGLVEDRQQAAGGKAKLTLKQALGSISGGETIDGFTPLGKIVAGKAAAILCSADPANGAIYRHTVGKGQAFYLNLSLIPYREERQMGGRGEKVFRQLIGGVLDLAGVRPEFAVEATGKKEFHGHSVSFTDGAVRYIGLIREYAGGEPEAGFAIRLPGKFCVYDVRAKKYLGNIDVINTVFYAGAAKLYALVPQEMKAPGLTCPETIQCGAKLSGEVELAEPKNACRAVRVEVYDPAGALRPYYSGPQLIKPGDTKAKFDFITALNDPPGKWTVKAVELLSGKAVERKFTVSQ